MIASVWAEGLTKHAGGSCHLYSIRKLNKELSSLGYKKFQKMFELSLFNGVQGQQIHFFNQIYLHSFQVIETNAKQI